MPQVTCTEIWDTPMERIYQTIVDYGAYPQFVQGVDEVEVLKQDSEGARVQYSLHIIKKVSYILKLTHREPYEVSWMLESGDLFKQNNGSWKLKDLGEGKTEVTYGIEVGLKGFIPKMVVDKLTNKNLPAMMKSFRQRVQHH